MRGGRWPTFAGPRRTYAGFELLGRTLVARIPLAGAARGPFWGTGSFVCCPVLVEIPIASTATKQSAGNLDSFINFLCRLNIINVVLLQASAETPSKLYRHWANYLLDRKSTNECTSYEIRARRIKGARKIPAGMLQSVIWNLQSTILCWGLSSVGRAPQWH